MAQWLPNWKFHSQHQKHKKKGSHSQVGDEKWLKESELYNDISNTILAVVLE